MADHIGLLAIAVVLLVLIAVQVPVAFALLASSIVGFLLFLPPEQITVIGSTLWSSVDNPIVAAIPLFILMGEIFARSKLSRSTYISISGLLDQLPGGLLHSNIAACAVFAAASGSSTGSAAAMGRAATPQLNERNYPRALTYGSLAAGGTLGILIPPSIGLILFGVLTGTSIGQLFIAGVFPGLALAVSFMLLIMLLSLTWYRREMPKPDASPLLERIKNARGVLPLLVVVVLVIGSLYFGVATPTESGAVGAASMAVIAGAGWRMPWRDVWEALRGTVAITGMILVILMAASLMGYIVSISGLSATLAGAAADFDGNRYLVLGFITIVLLILGMFLDPISLVALSLPVIFPISQALEFDPLWFGIFVIVNVEIGLITPPIGLNLFILKAVDPTSEWRDVIVGALPFVGAMLAFLVLLAFWPDLATWLPEQTR